MNDGIVRYDTRNNIMMGLKEFLNDPLILACMGRGAAGEHAKGTGRGLITLYMDGFHFG